MFYVYVLQSLVYPDQLYVGSTIDLKKRFERHNNGKEISTKRYMPWKLLYYEAYSNENLARTRERRLKHHGNAMKELKKRIMELSATRSGLHPAPHNAGLSMDEGLTTEKTGILRVTVRKSGAGFTLIELLVGVTILATLVGGLFLTLNPFRQIQKGQDSKRQSDLQQVKNALESYYQDNNCYPETLTFGQEWSSSTTVYMKEVPQDPTCNQFNGYCYQYITDTTTGDNCPQWNVVFAKLSQKPPQTTICPLSSVADACVPDGYDETWACVLSGAVNCQLVGVSGFDYLGGGGGGAEPTPTSGIEPTPTLSPGAVTYTLGGGSQYNPYMKTMTISPLWPDPPGIAQTFILAAEDATSDIVSAKIHLYSDNLSQILTLSHSGGTLTNGTWSGTISADTYNNKFTMAIVSVDANGNDRCTVLTPGGSSPEPDNICDVINQ